MMRNMITRGLVFTVLGLVVGCEPSGKDGTEPSTRTVAAGKAAGQNVLLITLDTTRADRLGCYGYGPGETPALDALAARGTLFEHAYSQVPLTLPSHASILTGRYPREHGIRNNNRGALAPEVPTVAEVFKEKGYRTGAFIASYVLDSHYGLNQGFDVYNDEMTTARMDVQPGHWQEPANVVADRALKWLDTVKGDRFFAWVHFYDPHEPYEPPEAYAGKFEQPYDGEVAFVDSQVKRLTDWLAANKLDAKTLIVVAGDHGESFGEHGENGHSVFLYETNLHVPLIFAHPTMAAGGRRVPQLVELVDIFPTLMELFGWNPPQPLHARSLADALRGKEIEDVSCYAESHHVKDTFNWAEQRSLTTPRWKYVSSTIPELFDRQTDPDEKDNLAESQPDVAKNMREALIVRYAEMIPGKAAHVDPTPSQSEALAALGYIGSNVKITPDSDEFLTLGLQDPKEKLILMTQVKAGMAALAKGDYDSAIQLLQHVVDECPMAVAAVTSLAQAQLQSGQAELVEGTVKNVYEKDKLDYAVNVVQADAAMVLRQWDKAINFYKVALGDGLPYADVNAQLGIAYRQKGDIDLAKEYLTKALTILPDFPMAHVELADMLLEQGDAPRAIEHYKKAIELQPQYATAHYNLGLALKEQNRMDEAVTSFKAAIEAKPDYGDAMINLALALRSLGRRDEARETLNHATEVPAVAARACYLLGVMYAEEGKIDRTVELYEKALTLHPFDPSPVTELAKYYVMVAKKPLESIRVLNIGATEAPEDVNILVMLTTMLATSSDGSVRDGARAVELGKRAAKLTGNKNANVLRFLAAAYAEAGQFDEARTTAEQALALAEKQGAQNIAQLLRQELEKYRNNEAIRNPSF